MRRQEQRKEFMREFAQIAKLARQEGDHESWRIAANEWRRLTTRGEIERAPDYLALN